MLRAAAEKNKSDCTLAQKVCHIFSVSFCVSKNKEWSGKIHNDYKKEVIWQRIAEKMEFKGTIERKSGCT